MARYGEGYYFYEVIDKARKMLDSFGRIEGGGCEGVSCARCPFNKGGCCRYTIRTLATNPEWFVDIAMNYEDPIDWSAVPTNTPILVRDNSHDEWCKKNFAFYVNGYIWAFDDEEESETAEVAYRWNYAKIDK